MFRPLNFWLFLLLTACAPSRTDRRDIPLPFEQLVLLLPKSSVALEFVLPDAHPDRVDVGIDFDGDPERASLHVRDRRGDILSSGRVSGSSMRRVACGVETDGRVLVHLSNHHFSSLRVAVRLAAAGSPMCAPPAPVSDEYWALEIGRWTRTAPGSSSGVGAP